MKKILSIIIVLVLAGLVFWKFKSDPAIPASTNTTPNNPTNNMMGNNLMMEEGTMMDNRKYKDGVYSATGKYVSPAGSEHIDITLVIKDDKIAEAVFVSGAENPTSKKMQNLFGIGFKQYVIGKSVDSVSLTVVNGSSLTPKGFMDALSKIKTEAKA